MELKPWTKFSYVEMKFFTMWYFRQTEEVKDKVKKFVQEGRLEFLNGGWSGNDEACPIFEDIIDNIMVGHAFLKKEFGVVPRVAWLVDSFGHSISNARLYSEIGFDSLFIARLDNQDSEQRDRKKELNYLWRPSKTHFGNRD